MNQLNLKLDDGTGEAFDQLLDKSREAKAYQVGDQIHIATKDYATENRNTLVIISFNTLLNGKEVPVQAVTTEALFLAAATGITAAKERREG